MRMRLNRTVSRWTRQGVLNLLLVCLMGGVVLARQLLIRPRVLQQVVQTTAATPTAQKLRLTDIFLPKTLRVEWDGVSGATVRLTRAAAGGTPVVLHDDVVPGNDVHISQTGGHFAYVDAFEFTPGQTYTYAVRQTAPPDPYILYTPSVPVSISVVPQVAAASDDQSVDARYDMRYSVWTFQNHRFGATTFRGGLYAGYNQDNSQVGHSYLKFPLSAGGNAWPAGSVNAWYTRSYGGGSTTVGCQAVPPGWDPAALVWTNAPAFSPAAAAPGQRFTVSYAASAPPAPCWAHWTMADDILAALGASGTLGVALGGTNEPSTATNPIGGQATGWAYFAKKEYQGGAHAPCVLYATGAPLAFLSLAITPAGVTGGGAASGRITLNGPAPSGLTLSLTSGNPSVVHVPASVTVPSGQNHVSFAVTTTAVSTAETDSVTAAGGDLGSVAGTITVTP